MLLAFDFSLLVTTGYLVDTRLLMVNSGYFSLILVPRFSLQRSKNVFHNI